MNKKRYIAPQMEVIEIDTVEMLALSIGIDKDGEGGSEQLSTGRRGSWGNLWSEDKE